MYHVLTLFHLLVTCAAYTVKAGSHWNMCISVRSGLDSPIIQTFMGRHKKNSASTTFSECGAQNHVYCKTMWFDERKLAAFVVPLMAPALVSQGQGVCV